MSKILRRPLFRGGRVDSTGVGITHGLDEGLHQSHQFHQSHHSGYATGGQVSKHMLEQNAPEGEFLAYINPREAALLKAHGGAGKATKYGIPSFEQLFGSSLPQDVNINDTGYINEKPLYTSSEMQAMTGTGEGGINATKAAEQIASKTGQAATNIGNKVYLPATIKEPKLKRSPPKFKPPFSVILPSTVILFLTYAFELNETSLSTDKCLFRETSELKVVLS